VPDSNARTNRDEILRAAFRRCGQDNPSTDDLALGVRVLNRVTRKLDAEGRWIWGVSNTPYQLTLSSSTADYAVGDLATEIPTGILALERVELSINTPPYWPLRILDKSAWLMSPLRGTSGEPLEVYLERQPTDASQKIWFAPTPDSAYTANVYYRRRLFDFDNATDNPDMPHECEQGVIEILTEALAPEIGVPLSEVLQGHKVYADEAKKTLRSANSENATPTILRTEYM